MKYERKTWKKGDVLKADDLNRIEGMLEKLAVLLPDEEPEAEKEPEAEAEEAPKEEAKPAKTTRAKKAE